MNVNQIVENKIDTAEKLAKAAGKPTNTFLFAPEINELVARVRLLWTLQNFDGSQIIPALKKNLGVLVSQTFIEKINSSAPSLYPSPCFVMYTIDDVSYVQAFVAGHGNYGNGATPVNEDMFILVQQSDEQLPVITPVRRYFFGDLTETNFVPFRNNLGYEVSCVQDGDYIKTNIPVFPTTYVNIVNRLSIVTGGGNKYLEYYNIGGYLSFKNIYTDDIGNETYIEITHAQIFIEQL